MLANYHKKATFSSDPAIEGEVSFNEINYGGWSRLHRREHPVIYPLNSSDVLAVLSVLPLWTSKAVTKRNELKILK